MAKGLIGRKLGMTQIFMGGEELIPVTVVEAGPCTVVQKKTREADGYDAIQVGFGDVKPHKVNRPLKGHFRKAGVEPRRVLREFRVDNPDEFEVGQVLKADMFQPGDLVDVTGFSKGRGFQGVVKRHGFGGGRATHGSMFHRAPGSIGAKEHPGKVWKGKKMAGRMGARRVTVQNLQVVEVDPERNLILLRGAVPGAKNGTVLLRPAVKAGNR
ncbi:50S ribosomal protein L3 [Deferrisoma camini]|uniref:50S ribosomal protein L3 n=1 Tax=Deferrisoma camini TaxID=1035120 RepID=UPI00046CAE86|nr:50S ribosomal protein L3 [Deferrisoma camini]